jgi:hypothetical protein
VVQLDSMTDFEKTTAGLVIVWLIVALPLAAWFGSPLILGAPFILLFGVMALLSAFTSLRRRWSR